MNRTAWRRVYDAYLFDLDGTLIDTVPDIHAALNVALTQHQFPEVSVKLTRHWIGHGAAALVRESLLYHEKRNPDEEIYNSMVATFLSHYAAHLSDLSMPYPGVIETLNALRARGAKLAVVTNKIAALSEPLLDQLGMSEFFEAIICGDSASKPKPAPEPVEMCVARLGVDATRALFVGDSGTDVGAAQAANMTVVCVRDGYNHGVDVTTLGADGVIDNFRELL